MRNQKTTNILLLAIALALCAIAIRPYLAPPPSHAVSAPPYPLYIEPGVYMLPSSNGIGNIYGKIVVDLRNGTIWGFPTAEDAPYPVDMNSAKPPVSHPVELGSFAYQDIER